MHITKAEVHSSNFEAGEIIFTFKYVIQMVTIIGGA